MSGMTINYRDFMRFVRDHEVRTIVSDLVAAREELPKVEARVAEIVGPVFARFEFWSAPYRGRAPERITDENNIYLAGPDGFTSPKAIEWWNARHEALVAAGYVLPGRDYCPAAMARCRVSDLEAALLERAGSTVDPAFAKAAESTIETYQEAVDLLIETVQTAVKEEPQPSTCGPSSGSAPTIARVRRSAATSTSPCSWWVGGVSCSTTRSRSRAS